MSGSEGRRRAIGRIAGYLCLSIPILRAPIGCETDLVFHASPALLVLGLLLIAGVKGSHWASFMFLLMLWTMDVMLALTLPSYARPSMLPLWMTIGLFFPAILAINLWMLNAAPTQRLARTAPRTPPDPQPTPQ